MARKLSGKAKRIVKTVRMEKEEVDLIIIKFGSIRKMVDAVLNKIRSSN